MADDRANRITEPKELRALSHPTRWAIIELLGLEETATATRCAEHTGESVASCSYHLGMLAKYGFVEQAEGGTGREKPWKLMRKQHSWDHDAPDVEGALAAEALTEVYLDHTVASMKDYMRRISREAPPWRDNAGTWATTAHVTADELAELAAELGAITTRFQERRDDPSLRPEGARPVRIFLGTWLPLPEN